MSRRTCLAAAVVLLAWTPMGLSSRSGSAPDKITIAADQPGAAIPATLFGLFFEDINFAADGGLYPERVKNRSFEFPDALMGWKRATLGEGTFEVRAEEPPSPGNPHYLRLTSHAGPEPFGVMNDGFRGVGVDEGASYRVSLLARRVSGDPGALRVELQARGGRPLGAVRFQALTGGWRGYEGIVTAEARELQGRVAVLVEGSATVDVDAVSVFPVETWNGRPNGLRKDLVALLKALEPGFLRFPGGCIVEGRYLSGRYRWKTTLGDPTERRLLVNRWNDEFSHRPAPDYYQSFGLGFFEYFLLAEDLGAEPLPILNCGMACQWNSGELAPLDALDEYIQDALDLIEFANGPHTTEWGRLRADLGHPEPFHLKFVGIGNEQWGPEYIERYREFQRVLRERHPEIRLIGSAGPAPADERFHFLWEQLRGLGADLVDEHYYMPPDWFLANAGRYDGYPRTGPKVFAGEYAAHTRAGGRVNRNVWEAGLAEAAFMTGLERNADVVEMASYAPLLAHVDAWQWSPNLIWFDNLRAFGTPSYHVQLLFGTNRGTRVLPIAVSGATRNGEEGLYTSASLDERSGDVIVKLVNTSGAARLVRLDLRGAGMSRTARAAVLKAAMHDENTIEDPARVRPTARPFDPAHPFELPARALTVLRVRLSS